MLMGRPSLVSTCFFQTSSRSFSAHPLTYSSNSASLWPGFISGSSSYPRMATLEETAPRRLRSSIGSLPLCDRTSPLSPTGCLPSL